MTIRSALRASYKALSNILPHVTVRNTKLLLGVLVLFGVVAPDTATKIRNTVLEPLELVSPGTGDLVEIGG